MNRQIWSRSITSVSCPTYPCSACDSGHLSLVQKSVQAYETAASKRHQATNDAHPCETKYTFTALAECRNPACKQKYAISGFGGVEEEPDEEYGTILSDYFKPETCVPMPNIISLPKKLPEEIKTELRSSFSLFWLSHEACAGRIRVSLELLMNHLKIQKKRRNKKGKFDDLTLHARIEIFAKSNGVLGEQLIALKWLGNSGSHTGQITTNDLLDAFEILESLLAEIIDKKSQRVTSLAKQLTKKHK